MAGVGAYTQLLPSSPADDFPLPWWESARCHNDDDGLITTRSAPVGRAEARPTPRLEDVLMQLSKGIDAHE
jgi:hypothetical protein